MKNRASKKYLKSKTHSNIPVAICTSRSGCTSRENKYCYFKPGCTAKMEIKNMDLREEN